MEEAEIAEQFFFRLHAAKENVHTWGGGSSMTFHFNAVHVSAMTGGGNTLVEGYYQISIFFQNIFSMSKSSIIYRQIVQKTTVTSQVIIPTYKNSLKTLKTRVFKQYEDGSRY